MQMMRKICRVLFLLAVAAVMLCFSLGACAAADGQAAKTAYPSLIDEAGLLTDAQRQTVLSSLQTVERRYSVRVGVVTVNGINMKAWQFADRLLDEAYTDGANGNMVLVMDMAKRDWFISTDPKMRALISDKDVELMGKRFVPYLSKGNYTSGFRVYAAAVNTNLKKKLQAAPAAGGQAASSVKTAAGAAAAAEGGRLVRSLQQERGGLELDLLGFAAVAAGILAYAFGKGLRGMMSNVSFNARADAYLVQDSFELQHSDDTYLYTSVRVIPRPKSSGTRGGFGRGGRGGAGGKF